MEPVFLFYGSEVSLLTKIIKILSTPQSLQIKFLLAT